MIKWIKQLVGYLYGTIDWAKRLICKRKGHDWDTYTVCTGYWSCDVEQAGYCKRCGHDTHGNYHKSKDGIW